MTTKIEWCDETINPIVGCTKISDGCRNCYAEKMAWRLKCMGIPKYQDVVDRNGWTGEIGVDMTAFEKLPKSPKRVFVDSMGDLFHDKVKEVDIVHIWTEMGEFYDKDDEIQDVSNRPGHTYLVLTKRPKRALDILSRGYLRGWERRNVWLGVSVEDADNLWRVDELLRIPAAVRFVSFEPLLDDIKIPDHFFSGVCIEHCETTMQTPCEDPETCFTKAKGIDWVIAGKENGPRARQCPEEAIKNLYSQCKSANIPFFDKSLNYISREFPREYLK